MIAIRHEFQEAMREESTAKVAELTGRKVVAMLSANHVNPDIGAEIYVLMDHPITSGSPPPSRPDGTPRLESDPHQDTDGSASPQV